MSDRPFDQLTQMLGSAPTRVEPVGAGAAGAVTRVHLADGRAVIVKDARNLLVEARSLALLAERSALPVPRVLHATDTRLVMTDLGPDEGPGPGAERHAAELLAALHCVTSPDGRYGLDFDNTIGPLPQPNGWSASWVEFYGDRRLGAMADAAARDGLLPAPARRRLDALRARLGEFIPDRPAASLIHGDVWGGNVIAAGGGPGGRLAGFIDPAPYYAHAEVELAFITMFGTFGPRFFDRYRELCGLDAGFEKCRRAVYLLYPLLTHVRIYGGGGYVGRLESTLAGLGF